jgi:hypothetical protein
MVSVRGTRSRRTSSARSRNYSSGGKRTDFPRASFQQHASARLERRARRADVIHQHDHSPPHVGASPHRERIFYVGMTRPGGKVGLRNRGARTFQCPDPRKRQVARNLCRLIESTHPFSRSMERHRHGNVRLCKNTRPAGCHQGRKRAPERFAAAVLQRVNDRSQRSIVLADGPSARDQMLAITAPRAGITRRPRSPGQQRVSTHLAERRSKRIDRPPA